MSDRLEKVKSLVQKELAKILLKESDFSYDVLVTLTRVDIPPDLRTANAKISVIPTQKTKEVINLLKHNIYDIQQQLNRRIRTRPVPKITFVEEKGTAEAARIEALLEKIQQG